tara:strand:+ start:34616 stop:34993 length:378 start_codon:yes stop_codon:yes gene_type:complete
MKSFWITASCALLLGISTSMAKAASLHGPYESENQISRIEWVVDLYYQRNSRTASLFTVEKFSSISQDRTSSLSFDHEKSDPLNLFFAPAEHNSEAFHEKWISLLLGVRTWDIETENSFYSPSDY